MPKLSCVASHPDVSLNIDEAGLPQGLPPKPSAQGGSSHTIHPDDKQRAPDQRRQRWKTGNSPTHSHGPGGVDGRSPRRSAGWSNHAASIATAVTPTPCDAACLRLPQLRVVPEQPGLPKFGSSQAMSIGTSAQLTQYEIAFDIDLLRELERTIQISPRLHQRQAELPAPQRWWRYASLSKLLLSVSTVPCDRSIGDDDADRRVLLNQFDGNGKNSLRLGALRRAAARGARS
jgi:hypothetical protein